MSVMFAEPRLLPLWAKFPFQYPLGGFPSEGEGSRRRSRSYSYTTCYHDLTWTIPSDEPSQKDAAVHTEEADPKKKKNNVDTRIEKEMLLYTHDNELLLCTDEGGELEVELPRLLGNPLGQAGRWTETPQKYGVENIGCNTETPQKVKAKKSEGDLGRTLMIRNAPFGVSQKYILKALKDIGLAEELVLLYVPGNLQSKLNPKKQQDSYAFVHVRSEWAESQLKKHWHNQFPFSSFNHNCWKAIDISRAKVQGAEANLQRWHTSKTCRIRNPNFRPMVFDEALSEMFGVPCSQV